MKKVVLILMGLSVVLFAGIFSKKIGTVESERGYNACYSTCISYKYNTPQKCYNRCKWHIVD